MNISPNILVIYANLLIKDSISSLFPDYNIQFVKYRDIATYKMELNQHDLIVIEYNPVSTLSKTIIRLIKKHIPNASTVLISAQGFETQTKQQLKNDVVDAILLNPTSLEIKETINHLLEESSYRYEADIKTISNSYSKINQQLQSLCMDAGAYGALLVKSDGYLLSQEGMSNQIDLRSVGALISANVAAANELSKLLGNKSPFESNYYSGTEYNIYTCMVIEDYFLAVIFGVDCKLGVIRFCAHETAKKIGLLVQGVLEQNQLHKSTLFNDTHQLIDKELEKLFRIS